MTAQTIRMEFAPSALSDLELRTVAGSFLQMIEASEPESWARHFASAVADGVLAPEVQRRITGAKPQVSVLELTDVPLSGIDAMATFTFAINASQHLREEGLAAPADFMLNVAAAFHKSAQVAYLEDLMELPDERKN